MTEYNQQNQCIACNKTRNDCNYNSICEDCDIMITISEPVTKNNPSIAQQIATKEEPNIQKVLNKMRKTKQNKKQTFKYADITARYNTLLKHKSRQHAQQTLIREILKIISEELK